MINEKIKDSWISGGTIISTGNKEFLIGWGEREWFESNSLDLQDQKPYFYFPDFFLGNKLHWFKHKYTQKISIECLHASLNEGENGVPNLYAWTKPDYSFFQSTFNDLMQRFERNELHKAVPFVTEIANSTMDRKQLLISLKNLVNLSFSNPHYIYGFWGGGEGILGATPELLFHFENEGYLSTMACAGTMSMQEDPAFFFNNPKERREHNLVIQGILDSLSRYGTVKTSDLELVKFPGIFHLVTRIGLQVNSHISFDDVINSLHPTPAIGAYPQVNGKKWLEEYQKKNDRWRFGAPVGYQVANSAEASCYVSIRNVQWTPKKMFISAGCGVVAESQVENEWAEINLKLKSIKEMLVL